MPLGVRVEVVANRLPAIAGGMRTGVAAAVGTTVFAAERGWKTRAHVITGAYRASITGRHTAGALEGTVSTALNYPYWEEYGNRYRPGHPAFRPAVAEQEPLHTKRVADALKRAAR